MESPQLEQTNAAAGDDGSDFYEKIEAPKFVDFTVPDCYRPNDRYWFCMRVGCDRKHEEEIDPEKISKSFVLRVMAARSPNVRLQKALNRKYPSSTTKKCPLSAPAKPSRRRLSKPTVVSSLSQKMKDAEVEDRTPLPKDSLISKAKTKQAIGVVAAKCLTTPRMRKGVPNRNLFRSVRNPKPTPAIEVSTNRVLAKALIFQSPKKVVGTKISQELKTPLTKICKEIKRLEKTSQQKRALQRPSKHPPRDIKRDYNKPWCLNSSSKSSSCKTKRQAKNAMCSLKHKMEDKAKCLQGCGGSLSYEAVVNYASDMEIDDKSRDGSVGVKSLTNGNSSNCASRAYCQETTDCALGVDRNSQSDHQAKDLEEHGDNAAPTCHHMHDDEQGKIQCVREKVCEEFFPESQPKNEACDGSEATQSEDREFELASDDRENSLEVTEESGDNEKFSPESKPTNAACNGSDASEGASLKSQSPEEACAGNETEDKQLLPDDKENSVEVKDYGDKENASPCHRDLNFDCDLPERKVSGIRENCKSFRKAIPTTNKVFKESLASAAAGTQELKYRRPKPTNPKPFRLRTEERGILREANLERRLQNVEPKKETATVCRLPRANSQRSHRNEVPVVSQQNLIAQTNTATGPVEHKTGKLLLSSKRRDMMKGKGKANLGDSALEHSEGNSDVSDKSGSIFRKNKYSSYEEEAVKTPGVVRARRKMASFAKPGSLSVIKEASSMASNNKPKKMESPSERGDTTQMAASISTPGTSSRPSSKKRTPATIPREPKFQSVRVPEGCTRILA